MATSERRAIGPAKVGAQAPAEDKKTEDVAAPVVETPPAADPVAPASPDNVDPIDVESPEYKAGYQLGVDKIDTGSPNFKAGYAAGLGAGGGSEPEPAPEPAPMKEPSAAHVSDLRASAACKAAMVNELRALAPDDNGFVLDCLGENLTLAQATAKYAGVLTAKLKTERTARVAAERKLAEETGSPAPVRTSSKEVPAAETATPEDPKSAAAAEWDADPAVRKGFTSKANFVAVRSAELAGRFRSLRIEAPATA